MNYRKLAKSVAMNNISYERFRLEDRRSDSLTARVIGEDNQSVIIKLWKRPGMKGKYRQLMHTGNLDREWTALNLLCRKEIKASKALACFRFNCPQNGYTDVLIMEDLGQSKRAVDVIPEVMDKNDNYVELKILEDKIISLTKSIIKAGIIDLDHHLVNILILPSGDVVRVDFEISTVVSWPFLHDKKLAMMLSYLLTTYIFSVQENIELIDSFAMRLNNHLQLSQKVLTNITSIVNKRLAEQENPQSITHWVAPW